MRLMRFTIMALLPCFLIAPAQALDWQWTGNVKISSVYPNANGLIFEAETDVNASNSRPKRMYATTSRANYEIYSAAIIGAFHADKSVNVVIDMDDTACGSKVERFQVFK